MIPILVAGNWKMNHGPRATEAFLDAYQALGTGGETGSSPVEPRPLRAILFPPAVSLDAASRRLDERSSGDPRLELGIQQIHPDPSGAFTGELSAPMAVEAGATFALTGHSERRTLFHETDDQVARRTQAALEAGLHPMVCVGETLEERRGDRLESVIRRQIGAVLSPPELRSAIVASLGRDPAGFSVAYEPVWAIGTGETASPGDAAAAHALIRDSLTSALGSEVGGRVCILYGGSVQPANASDLLAAPEVDGLLVGGASLTAASFRSLVEAGAARAGQGVHPDRR